jgi:ABC-type Fe3+/spermidine/putrescine transport system ATPase subunit
MGDRRISELSGGQQQRAALARAIVKRPALLLLDEPLGALDLKLRRQMQDELVHLKRETGTTFIHVTHDQEEACAIADRIAVMDQGLIVQVDTPQALYQAPRTSYVAGFIDAGTIVHGTSRRQSGMVEVAHPDLTVRGTPSPNLNGATAIAAVLPHDRVRLALGDDPTDGAQRAAGTVDRLVFTGSVFHAHVRISESLEIRAAVPPEDMARLPAERLQPGAAVDVTWSAEDVVFVEDSSARPAAP